MNRFLCLLLGTVLLAAVGGCGNQSGNQEVAEAMPPLLDRELFFGDPEISGSQLSPDGKWMTFIKPYNGARNIWVKAADEPFDAAPSPSPPTSARCPATSGAATASTCCTCRTRAATRTSTSGPSIPPATPDGEPACRAARDLTPVDGVRAQIYSVPKNAPDVIIVGLNDRDPSFHDVYKVDIATGERVLLRENDDGVGGWIFDLDGKLRLAYRQTARRRHRAPARRHAGPAPARRPAPTRKTSTPCGFHKDGQHCYVQHQQGRRRRPGAAHAAWTSRPASCSSWRTIPRTRWTSAAPSSIPRPTS